MEAGSLGEHAGDSHASSEAAVGELGFGKGRQQLLSETWSFTSISILYPY